MISVLIRCGCLQVGDRILAVNHKSVVLDSLNTNEVTQIFLCAEGSNRGALLTLHVEFDVADAVVPSSGIFSVKLARRGSGLGITITGMSNVSMKIAIFHLLYNFIISLPG